MPSSPIHDRDIFEQTEAMLGAAAPSCPIMTWGGDEPVAAQEWCGMRELAQARTDPPSGRRT